MDKTREILRTLIEPFLAADIDANRVSVGLFVELCKKYEKLRAEVEDARNCAAEIAQGVSHYPHDENYQCVRCQSEKVTREFKNFHRSLCERFGYFHDEKDWKRDQVSLEEHLASLKTSQADIEGKALERAAQIADKLARSCRYKQWRLAASALAFEIRSLSLGAGKT